MFHIRVVLVLLLIGSHALAEKTTAFHYGPSPPVDVLRHYDHVVVEPDHWSATDREQLEPPQLMAYVSVGEVRPSRSWFSDLDTGWLLEENPEWASRIVDPCAEWCAFLMKRRFEPLWRDGYRGFFLDTIDSPLAGVPADSALFEIRKAGLTRIVQQLRARFPKARIVVNRGFELLPQIASSIDGVVAESLYQSWTKAHGYHAVKREDRAWLLGKLNEARNTFDVPVTVIDYVSPTNRTLAVETARNIASHGFSPWVATPALDRIGVTAWEMIPRRVLMVYDERDATLAANDAHSLMAPCLEYAGFAVDYVDAAKPIEVANLERYAGVVTWLSTNRERKTPGLELWLEGCVEASLPILFVGGFGFSPTHRFMRKFEFEHSTSELERPVTVVATDDAVGFEAPPKDRSRGLVAIRSVNSDPLCSLVGSDRERVDTVAITPWGGFAFAPHVLRRRLDGKREWIVDPFKLTRRALRLPVIPTPDLTTENGSRLLMVHIGGSGASTAAEWRHGPLAIEVIHDEFLRRNDVPTTVSLTPMDLSHAGHEAGSHSEFEALARKLFTLKHVDAAIDASGVSPIGIELSETVRTLESLTPADKRVDIVLWSENTAVSGTRFSADPPRSWTHLSASQTQITRAHQSVTAISAAMRPVGTQLHAYAPVASENAYTNFWRGPFHGFRRVIETFELTDSPRRLKPIGVHYHFYSGTKRSSVAALRDVYDWVETQETVGVSIRHYASMVQGFHSGVVARDLDGAWRLLGFGELRTVRLPTALGWPDLGKSPSVVAVRDLPQGRYVSFSTHEPRLVLGSGPSSAPHVVRANARIVATRRSESFVALRFQSSGSVTLTARASRIEHRGKSVAGTRDQDRITVTIPEVNDDEVFLFGS